MTRWGCSMLTLLGERSIHRHWRQQGSWAAGFQKPQKILLSLDLAVPLLRISPKQSILCLQVILATRGAGQSAVGHSGDEAHRCPGVLGRWGVDVAEAQAKSESSWG